MLTLLLVSTVPASPFIGKSFFPESTPDEALPPSFLLLLVASPPLGGGDGVSLFVPSSGFPSGVEEVDPSPFGGGLAASPWAPPSSPGGGDGGEGRGKGFTTGTFTGGGGDDGVGTGGGDVVAGTVTTIVLLSVGAAVIGGNAGTLMIGPLPSSPPWTAFPGLGASTGPGPTTGVLAAGAWVGGVAGGVVVAGLSINDPSSGVEFAPSPVVLETVPLVVGTLTVGPLPDWT